MGLEVTGNVTALAPTAADHLATKAYVDAAVSAGGGGGGLKVYKSDGVTVIGNFLGYDTQNFDSPVDLCSRLMYSDTSGNIVGMNTSTCAGYYPNVTNAGTKYYFPNTTCSGNRVFSYPTSAGDSITIQN